VEKLQRAVIQGLSEDLRPRSSSEYYYKMHRDHEGFEEAVMAKENKQSSGLLDKERDGGRATEDLVKEASA
jgi:hypothetical protein